MRNHNLTKTLLLALGLGCSLSVSARERMDAAAQAGGGKPGGSGNRITANCLTSSSFSSLDINNVRAMVLNGGDMWWDFSSARYEVPKVNDPNLPKRHAIFAGAVWIGGKDAQNNLYTATQTYRQFTPPEQGYWPGPLDNNTGDITKEDCAAWNYHSKIDQSVVDKFRTDFQAGAITKVEDLPKAIKDWPGRNNPEIRNTNMNYELAPFVNVAGAIDAYEPLLGDYPDFRGDQGIWWVMNDAGGIKTPQSKKIGLEVQVLGFAFQTNDLINNMTFYKQILKNKGTTQLNDTYIGQWVDPDLGFYNDDYVGCDVGRGLGICYNGDNDDEGPNGYGLNPPAVGVDFFQGPLADPNDGLDNNRNGVIDEQGETIIMSSFIYFNNDSNPTNGNPNKNNASDYYNYLQAIWKDGKKITFGTDGTDQGKPTYKFMFPGNSDPKGYGFGNPPANPPIAPPFANWTETNRDGAGAQNTPADRRFLQSAGPFTLKPGSVNELTIGVVWARANSGGAQGSLGLLQYADDRAQRLFDNDFKLPQGPDAPLTKIAELDQQLVLSLDASRQFRNSNGDLVTTETYFETDNSLKQNDSIKDPVYRFEGYKIYQLKDLSVSASELEDKNRARLVAQADVKNGVTNIVNYDFDAELNMTVPKLRVRGTDKGVFHTLNITTDLFATGNERIVNFKSYHYMVIAYAYNGDPFNKDDKYLEGRRVAIVTGIPHKTQSENGGTYLNSNYGKAAEITRIFGVGNGGNVLEITPQDEQDIVKDFSKKELHYQPNHAPFVVKVYDPKLVKGGDFVVKLSSRLVYKKAGAVGASIKVDDTIVATGNFNGPTTVNTVKTNYQKAKYPQVPGRAIVKRIIESTIFEKGNQVDLVTLDIEMLNDHLGGTFQFQVDQYAVSAGPPIEYTLENHIVETRPFKVEKTSVEVVADQFYLNDFWKIRNKADSNSNNWVFADRPISEFNEQLLPEYGVAIEFKNATNPGFQVKLNGLNGYLESSVGFTGKKWFNGINSNTNEIVWLLPKSTLAAPNVTKDLDPNFNYLALTSGWAPYNVTQKSTGPAYAGTTDESRKLSDLQNVDIVFTSDRSKWTRVPVLQGSGGGHPGFFLSTKNSTVPSIDAEGNATGEDSPFPKKKGGVVRKSLSMGWFPGYAIDLDRGIRLNMMFAEFGAANTTINDATDPGRNLKWEPTNAIDGGKNYIYVLKTKYDLGKEAEYALDSARYTYPNLGNPFQALVQTAVFDNAIWAGNVRLNNNSQVSETDARVRLRVNRSFTSYNPDNKYNVTPKNGKAPYTVNTNPEYAFSTNGLVPELERKDVAKSALDLIRVVPNPYYAFSQYEQRQLDNIVKITNLPRKCKVSIFTVNGTLVKTFNKDDKFTWLDWTLKNDANLPIASGVYIINVDAGSIGSKVVKFFGIMRPVDLDAF